MVFPCTRSRAGHLAGIHNLVLGETMLCDHLLLKLEQFTGVRISGDEAPHPEPVKEDASTWK